MTPEQRMAALEHANEIRCGRARVKRDMRAGKVLIARAMGMELCASMELLDLVMCVPKVGRVKALKIIGRLGISPSRRIDGLSERQVGAIAAACAGVTPGGAA